MMRIIFSLLFCLWCYSSVLGSDQHPRLYVSNSDKANIQRKIENYEWAKSAFNAIKVKIEPYADRHINDPQWIISRLAMYWKDGERYTQCYLKKQNWDRGEGNAPIPTVRMPGMRTWNKYANVPLEDRIPYNETGDMLGINRLNPELPPVLVPYKESGHMVRYNNQEIITMAEEAAFLYWVTGEEKYVKFASDIYQTWLLGTYYMNPIKDPEKSTNGYGGWEPGGICGYYDYEQIHDNLAFHAAVVYDFAYDYMVKHPHEHLKVIKKELRGVTDEVFKRFIDLGMVRGGKLGNWNVNGWNVIIRPILMLGSNNEYKDGKGREYYLHYLTTESTEYHNAIPDILSIYDNVTGLWPESPGYSFGTVQSILEWQVMLRRVGVDIMEGNAIMQKAALAVIPWMDETGNMVVFGDTRGGSAYFQTFENLLPYYMGKGDRDKIAVLAQALNDGLAHDKYDRSKSSWEGICSYAGEIPSGVKVTPERSSYSPHHRFITMKNWTGNYKMMTAFYGGKKKSHLVSNGLAVQFYAFGYALAPDAAAYESYWSKDYAYHQAATGANTILPGYTEGDIEIEAMEPTVNEGHYTNTNSLTPYLNFADVTAAEKRRTIAMMKVGDEAGYYVDIFRSNQDENDYIFHNVGQKMSVTTERGNELDYVAEKSLKKKYSAGYDYFEDFRRIDTADDFVANWNFPEDINARLWMTGNEQRVIYQMTAPPSTFNDGITPGGACKAPQRTPTLLVRQDGINGKSYPFMSVYEAYKFNNSIITDVNVLNTGSDCVGLEVVLKGDRKDYFLSSVVEGEQTVNGIRVNGTFAQITEQNGKLISMYLGKGTSLKKGTVSIAAEDSQHVYAAIYKEGGQWYYSATGRIKVSNDKKTQILEKAENKKFVF